MLGNNRGQVTLYVIIGIVIVAAGIIIFSIGGKSSVSNVPEFVSPIENSFLNCIEEEAQVGIEILSSRGGYLNNPSFVAGSVYQPFSSELDFGGIGIPYWYYIRGSNIESVQVPTREKMEEDLADYLEEEIKSCGFQDYLEQGYEINLGEVSVEVGIGGDYVDTEVRADLSVSKDYQSSIVQEHSVRVDSRLGELYDAAKEVYEKEEEDMFLENYSVDVMRLNLPVDGFEISCSPLEWNGSMLYSDFSNALEANTILLNNRGENEDYYDVGFSGDVDLRFIYSSNWPTYFEVNPTRDEMLVANPIGGDGELGLLGFCYVPYHFVYDIRHPVLVQVTRGDETFQFPLVVVIDGNVAKESKAVESISPAESSQICQEMNLGETQINVYDYDLNELEADLSFSCFDSVCNLGSAEGGEYVGSIPQCVNGVLEASLSGYKTASKIYSTVENTTIVMVLEKEYEKDISLIVGGQEYLGKAMIVLNSGEESKTVFYPQEKTVNISSGDWEVEVSLISNTSIEFPETTQEQCYEVSRPGPLGLIGFTREECTEVTIPQQVIGEAIVGGDSVGVSFSLEKVRNSNVLEISDLDERVPTTIEELQVNYALLESGVMDVELR